MAAAADAQSRPFAQALKEAQSRITAHMEARLGGNDPLHAAMRYAITGGKNKFGFTQGDLAGVDADRAKVFNSH